jgi:hypothetical protein
MPKITELWAWVNTEADENDEGIIAHEVYDVIKGETHWMPLVGADKARIESLRDVAKATAERLGKPVKLLKFSTREEIETVTP